MILASLSLGCASSEGWRLSEARTCAPKDVPRVCVVAEPDYGHVVALADVEMLPGECAQADADGRGGLVRVSIRDRVGEERKRWVSAPRGQATLLELDEAGKPDATRERCDQTPFSVGASSSRD